MAYVPRQRRYKVRWKVVDPLLVLIALIVYLLIGMFLPSNHQEVKKFTVCGLNEEQTIKALHKTSKETISVSDYLYYGESLDLYEKKYSPENKDTLSGKTVELKNICDGKTISMTMENTVDQKILLDEIPEGYYEVSIIDNLVKKRVIFQQPLKENAFYTAQRKGKVNKVSLIADTQLLKDYQITLDKNYLFLQVTSQTPRKGDIDVLIDPFGMNTDLTWLPDEGSKVNGLNENDEMYKAAVLMKKELEEKYGLRVAITKASKDEKGKAYGSDGRLAKGYKQHAKYYLFLRFSNYANDTIRGFEVAHSYYSSKTLARNLTYGVHKNLKMPLSPMYTGSDAGIVTGLLAEGADGKTIYDTNLYLRESGGRATLAGKYSETSQEQNADFVNANGMQGLEIDFVYISNKEDAALWKKQKNAIIKETARAFAEGINADNTTR